MSGNGVLVMCAQLCPRYAGGGAQDSGFSGARWDRQEEEGPSTAAWGPIAAPARSSCQSAMLVLGTRR